MHGNSCTSQEQTNAAAVCWGSEEHDPEDNPGSGISVVAFIVSQNGQLKHRIQSVVFLCVTKSDRCAPHSKTNWVFCTQNKHSFFNICNYLGCLRVILILIYSYMHTSLAWHLQMHRDQNCKHSSAQFHFFFFSARMSSHQLKHRSSMRPGREEPLILFRYVWICFIPVQLRGIAIAIILVGNELGAFYYLISK